MLPGASRGLFLHLLGHRVMGYSPSEIEEIQQRWSLRFPPDLVELLSEHRPLLSGRGSFDWLLSDPAVIRERLEWPFDGFWFDVEHSDVWWSEWGVRPDEQDARRHHLREILDEAPRLIPLFAHRYIPEEPFERGNPVFSVYQTDVIYYGSDLQNWLARELPAAPSSLPPLGPIKPIRFWSDAVTRNNAPYV